MGTLSKDGRSYVAGRFCLVLDGSKNAGFLKSVEGGAISSDVVVEKLGPDNVARKNLNGIISYSDFKAQLGFACSPDMYAWIAASWSKNYTRKNGAVLAANFNYETMSSREFTNALVVETVMPKMDGSSKEACYMTVSWACETIRYKAGDGAKITGETGKGEQKKWLPSNFRLEIDGLDCTKVNAVESFTIKQKAIRDEVGQDKDYLKEPASVEYPNLEFTLSQTTAQSWIDYFDSFVIQGNQGTDAEKTGSLVYMAPNGKDELGRVNFKGMGIHQLTDDKGEAGAESIKRIKVGMYVEEMALVYGSAVIK